MLRGPTRTAADASGADLTSFLGSLQLADSFFPSGLYTLPCGLEAFVQAGLLQQAGMEELLVDCLHSCGGPAGGAALACAHRGAATGMLELAAAADRRLTEVRYETLPARPR